jgi:hypothetical protein
VSALHASVKQLFWKRKEERNLWKKMKNGRTKTPWVTLGKRTVAVVEKINIYRLIFQSRLI